MDVVGLVHKAWNSSFARVETIHKAITKQGWEPRPLNYDALLHPEVHTSKSGYKNDSEVEILHS
jgi:hypothetical protein